MLTKSAGSRKNQSEQSSCDLTAAMMTGGDLIESGLTAHSKMSNLTTQLAS